MLYIKCLKKTLLLIKHDVKDRTNPKHVVFLLALLKLPLVVHLYFSQDNSIFQNKQVSKKIVKIKMDKGRRLSGLVLEPERLSPKKIIRDHLWSKHETSLSSSKYENSWKSCLLFSLSTVIINDWWGCFVVRKSIKKVLKKVLIDKFVRRWLPLRICCIIYW